ncbi:MAG: hypothetical protein AW08_00789 [Candidatus Accumulibacter adjunctus]|uniref:Periplasmic heavy metal sensor n=1 Tax=Candidatus Accumulibacter adjunctus TaxID=1454001 RepID=A0A011MGK8_9PROT|nr:MAG: hypothetical protein AW08_00789 [Candidatus Accumulibacter adjunctus]
MKSMFKPRVVLVALLLSLGAAGSALAMRPESCGAGGPRMEQRMGWHLQEMSRLHGELKLDARQEALWQEAEQFTRNGMREVGEQMRQQRAEVLALVSKPGADLRAVLTRMDDVRDAARKQRELGRERWLAVYDSLDAAQKEKARQFVQARLERMGQGGRFGPGGPGGPRGPGGPGAPAVR